MLVLELKSYFEELYGVESWKSAFEGCKSDVNRIKRNKRPLKLYDNENLCVLQTPLSLENLRRAMFCNSGEALVINRTSDSYRKLTKEDDLKTWLQWFSTIKPYETSYVLFKPATRNDNSAFFFDGDADTERASLVMKNIRKAFCEAPMSPQYRFDIKRENVLLSCLLWSDPAHVSLFYFSLFYETRLTDELDKRTHRIDYFTSVDAVGGLCPSIPAVLLHGVDNEDSVFVSLYDRDVFFFKGLPIRGRDRVRYMGRKREIYEDYVSRPLATSIPFNLGYMSSICKKLSKAVHFVSHLEKRGCAPFERDVSLEINKKERRFVDEERFMTLNEEDCITYRPDTVNIDYLFDGLKSRRNDLSVWQGCSFLDTSFDPEDSFTCSIKRSYGDLLAVFYAYQQVALCRPGMTYENVRFRGSAPSLDSYEWYITKEGEVYYRRTRDGKHGGVKRKLDDTEYTKHIVDKCSLSKKNHSSEEKRPKKKARPSFLEGLDVVSEKTRKTRIPLEKDAANNDTSVLDTNAFELEDTTDFGKYQNENASVSVRKMYRQSKGDLIPTVFPVLYVYTPKNPVPEYDPYILRKYDGKSVYPTMIYEPNLDIVLSKKKILFSSNDAIDYACERLRTPLSVFHLSEKRNESYGLKPPVKTNARNTRMVKKSKIFRKMVELVAGFLTLVDMTITGRFDFLEIFSKSMDRGDGRISIGSCRSKGGPSVDMKNCVADVLSNLVPDGAKLRKDCGFHGSDPLWMLACICSCSRMTKCETACLLYDEVPRSLYEVFFYFIWYKSLVPDDLILMLGTVSTIEYGIKYTVYLIRPLKKDKESLPYAYDVYELHETKYKKKKNKEEEQAEELLFLGTPVIPGDFDEILKSAILCAYYLDTF
jgi:hypothetical protein